jgi:hypothetical protein
MDILRIIEGYNTNWDEYFNYLKDMLWYDDNKIIIDKIITLINLIERQRISLQNPKLLITIGKENDCPYQELLENYLEKNIFDIYEKLKISKCITISN